MKMQQDSPGPQEPAIIFPGPPLPCLGKMATRFLRAAWCTFAKIWRYMEKDRHAETEADCVMNDSGKICLLINFNIVLKIY